MVTRRERRRALTVSVGAPVPYTDPRALRTPWWVRLRAALGLSTLVVILGLALTVVIGVTLLLLFLVSDQIIG